MTIRESRVRTCLRCRREIDGVKVREGVVRMNAVVCHDCYRPWMDQDLEDDISRSGNDHKWRSDRCPPRE